MKIVVTAGGGGHFAAALAVMQAMPKDWEVLMIGRKYAFEADKTISLEYQTAQALGIVFTSLPSSRLQRKWTKQTIPSLLKFPAGFFQAYRILQSHKPSLVLSFGGYSSLPVVLAASLLGIPIVLHEQTLQAGLANKISAYFARAVCLSWEASKRYFPANKTVVTGNPLNVAIMDKKSSLIQSVGTEEASLPLLYITGGSLGSHAINLLIEGCIEKLLEKYVVIHQTGDALQYKDFDRLTEKRSRMSLSLQKRYILTKFVDPHELGSILGKATLVVARSGINTVSEMLYFGKMVLFIPLPIAAGNEQWENALFLKKQGLGEVFAQDTMTPEKLYEHIVSMVHHKDRYEKNVSKAKSLIDMHAAQNILAVCKKSLYD